MNFSRCSLAALLLCAFASISGAELLRFRAGEVTLAGEKRAGTDKFSISAEQLPDTGREGTVLRWTPGCSPFIECWSSARMAAFSQFHAAEFTLNAWLLPNHSVDSVTLRFIDAQGEVFQFWREALQSMSGRQKFTCRIDSSREYANSFGGNRDKKIDWPLRFHGIVCGGLDKVRQPGGIILDSLEYRIEGAAVTVGFSPEHPLNLVLPEMKIPPSLCFRNHGSESTRLTGAVKVRDAYGREHSADIAVEVPAESGDGVLSPLPGDFSRLGIWYASWTLRDDAGKRYDGTRQFAAMVPALPFGTGGFLLGASGAAGPNGRLAQELAGVRSLRSNPDWWQMQPKPEAWDYRIHDKFFASCARRNLAVHFLIGPPPEWAVPKDYKPINPKAKNAWKRPDYEAYRAFLSRLAERYKGRGTIYIVGNEPDLVSFCNFSDDEYLEMLKIAYRTIKAADPGALVANGGISSIFSAAPRSSDFLRCHPKLLSRLLTEGRQYYDVFDFHGHGPASIYRDQLRELRKMKAIGAGKPWISAETGISSTGIGELEQARTLFKKVILARAYGASSYDWYNFWDIGTDPADPEHNFGLLKHDYQPKAAYPVFNIMARYFQTPEFVRQFEEGENVYGCFFREEDGEYRIPYWSFNQLDPEQLIILTGIGASAVGVDLFGNESACEVRNGAVLLKVSEDPAFLRTVADADPQWRGLLLSCDALSITPGENGVFRFHLRNPLDRRLDCRFVFRLPAGLAAETEKSISLGPGRSADVKLNVRAEEGFRSFPLNPERVEIAFFANDFPEAKLNRAVVSNIPVRLDVYPELPTFRLDDASQVMNYAISGPENHLLWKGADDLSADIFLARNQKYLRLKAVVRDDVHHQPYRGGGVWNGDGIQFAIRLPDQKRTWEFGLTRLANGSSEVWCWNAPAGFDPAETARRITLETVRDDRAGKTVYEAQIPLEAIGLTQACGKAGFHFNLLVNDNDGEKRESCIRIVPGIESDKNWTCYPLVNFR
ncbi:MAG: hypothetical protein HPZ91_20650 [Lentisphaeria bacterium]|nr:hypothetical protein [Lentisphaeria bacterium]